MPRLVQNHSEMEAAETQVWLDYAVECGYVSTKEAAELYPLYDGIIASLVVISHSQFGTRRRGGTGWAVFLP
jgi:hypothetical protein